MTLNGIMTANGCCLSLSTACICNAIDGWPSNQAPRSRCPTRNSSMNSAAINVWYRPPFAWSMSARLSKR